MKTLFASTVAVAALLAAPAMAQNFAPEYYGTLGYSKLDASEADLGAVTGRIGAKFNPYFGVEGEASFGVNDDTVNVAGVNVDIEHRYDLAAYAVGSLPITPDFDIFARVGYGTTEIKASAAGISAREDGESWNYGVGANYLFDGQNGVRGDWTRRDFRSGGGEADVYSLNYVRRF